MSDVGDPPLSPVALTHSDTPVDVQAIPGGGNPDHFAFPGLCATNDGLMAAYRKNDGHGVDSTATLVAKRSTDDGATWGTEYELYDPTPDPRDVTLSRLSDGTIAMTCFHYPDAFSYQSHVMFSADDGLTFGTPVALESDRLDVVHAITGPIIETDSGLLAFIYGEGTGDTYQSAVVMRSTDGGDTWADLAVIADGADGSQAFHEPFATVLDTGRIWCALRRPDEKLWWVESDDDGETWTDPTQVNLSRGGRPAVCQMANGALILSDRLNTWTFYRVSWDRGVTWGAATTFDTGFRGAYAQMLPVGDALAMLWAMEDPTAGQSGVHFTYIFEDGGTDPLA